MHIPSDAQAAGFSGRLLLVGSSARMLAQSARRAGFRPFALDLFGDADTREHCAGLEVVPPGEVGFDGQALIEAADRLAPPGAGFDLVYGSGLDGEIELLRDLGRGRRLLGNPPETMAQIKTPARFFPLLDRLEIPYPETCFERPADPRAWLIKAGCGQGGKRVRFCADTDLGPGEYCQKLLEGPAQSALFIADGRRARVIGFNTLWTASHYGQPFLFIGAMNQASLDTELRTRIAYWVDRLTAALGLAGLNSLDFMLEGQDARVLEINPRPSATLGLYDQDFPQGLLLTHMQACLGRLPDGTGHSELVRAFRVVFAPAAIRVDDRPFPAGCADRPVAGSLVETGAPFCTVEAEGLDAASVEARLHELEASLINHWF